MSESYDGGSALTGADDIASELLRLRRIAKRFQDGGKPAIRRNRVDVDYPLGFEDAFGRTQAYRVADDGRKVLRPMRRKAFQWSWGVSSGEMRRIREATAYREGFDGPETLRATAAAQGRNPLDVVLEARNWQETARPVGPDPMRGTMALVPAIPTPTPEPVRTVARVVTRAGIRLAERDYRGRTIRYL